MRTLWDIAIEPILEAARPERILEIGVDSGLTTEALLDFVTERGGLIEAVDPEPKLDVDEWSARHPEHIRFHLGLSLEVLPGIDCVDVALIDGDHNWYTVYHELLLLEEAARRADRRAPVLILHDTSWPYAHRDLYYNPHTIPENYRHPHQRGGVVPGRDDLVSGGFNAHLQHATHEHGERNGVRTAVDDFVHVSNGDWRVAFVEGEHGLAVLATDDTLSANGRLSDAFDALDGAEFATALVDVLETHRHMTQAALQDARRQLHDAAAERERTDERLAAAEQELANLRAAATAHETATTEGAALANERDDAVEARRAAEARAAASQSAAEQARAASAAAETARADAESDVEAARADAERAEAAAQRARAVAEQASADATQARADLAEAKAAHADADADSERARHEAGQARAGEATARDDLRDARAQLATARDDAARSEAALAAVRGEAARTHTVLTERDAELAESRRVGAERGDALVDAARQNAALEGRNDALERELKTVVADRDDARRERAAAATSAREAGAERDAETQRADRAERRATASEAHEDELEGDLRNAVRATRDAEDGRQAAERERKQADKRLRKAERAAKAAHETATTERAKAQASAGKVEQRERELEDVAQARARLAADVDDTRESLERALDEARAQAGAARVAARELRERLEARELESDGLHQQIRSLKQALVEARTEAELGHAVDARTPDEEPVVSPVAPAVAPPEPVVEPEASAPLTRAPSSSAPDIAFTETELAAHEYFRREYPDPPPAAGEPAVVDAVALPMPRDDRGVCVAEHPTDAAQPTVDIVVCVHNALADVRLCLWSILAKTDSAHRIIVVNDGSGEGTTTFLRDLVRDVPAIRLVENLSEPHGYTIAANLGLRASTADYVILLNSDTIVTHGWLERIVECGESEPNVGILGPLSNAASHQSIPELRDDVGWSTNPLPSFTTPDGIATLLQRSSRRDRPRLPFINGFCYVVKRAVIDAIGYLDEERFASGYCEENDYSVRAANAGFELAVIDDAYVFHAKSKSFTVEGRKVLAKRNYEIFLDKHGRERIQEQVRGMEANTALSPLRVSTSDALSSPSALASALDSAHIEPLSVVFVLPGLGVGGSGGSHSIYQEVQGMQALGLDARIALAAKAMDRARDAYGDADEVFMPYRDIDELAAITAQADVVSATHFKSATLVAQLRERRSDFIPAYYVQDYEPFFTAKDSDDVAEAIESYTLIPDCLLFAKTHWLCNIVAQRHGIRVAKVEPSIDERVYRPSGYPRDGRRVQVAAMIRPRTPRRQPSATLWVLEQLRKQRPDVSVVTFGCPQAELERMTGDRALRRSHRPVLPRVEVAELLAASDVFLDMSMYQAFGRTALEAMACGATAIVPRLGGVWEFLEHDRNAVAVDAFEPQQAVDVLVSLADDTEKLRTLQAAALQTGARYSIMRAALSEYLTFARERRLRSGAAVTR